MLFVDYLNHFQVEGIGNMILGERLSRAFAGSCATLMLSALLMAFVPGVAAEPVEVRTDLPSLAVPRAGSGVVMGDDGLIYIFGGSNDYGAFNRALDTVVIYDPATGATTYGPEMTAGVVMPASALGHDGKIYVFGGFNFTIGNVYRGVQIFDPATSTWATDMTMPADSYMGGAACGADGRIFVVGGWTASTDAINYTLIYDPDAVGAKWSYGADLLDPRWGPAVMFVSATEIMVAGGSDWGGPVGTTSFYNPVTNTWSDGGDLATPRHSFGLVMGSNGYAYALGGTDFWAWPSTTISLTSIERYDFVADEWEPADVSLWNPRAFLNAVVTSDGFIITAGGWDGSSTLASVEAILPLDVTGLTELAIVSPGDGSTVSGVVEVRVMIRNNVGWSWFMSMDLLVDGARIETQWSGSSWTFLWDTSLLPDGSVHTLTAHGYDYDMKVVEDSVTVTVSSLSVEERIAAIEQELADVQAQIVELQSQLSTQDANLTALRAVANGLQLQLNGVIAGLTAMGAEQTAAMAALNLTLVNLQSQLDDFQEQIDRVENKADTGGTYGMITMILVIVIVALLALMMVMARKKP
ncbi:MAG: hypothetical protein A3K60_04685 [Euryarchaeota archaeon RBG_19FT_COMBO_56_21]|nr:MAG: hypothetical protein A3K60_04685 [Euryarchaeota archaeon RBG_19FT_COMBO_56_21]